MKKRILAIVVSTVMLLSVFAACKGDESVQLTGFDVTEHVEVSYGMMYTVPTYVPKDNNGNIYSVSYAVKNGGETVEVFADKFAVSKTTDYIIEYTATFEKNTFQKTSTIKVKDTTKPLVVLSDIDKLYVIGDTVTLPEAKITDDLDENLSATFVITYKEEKVDLNAEGTGFTVSKVGVYKITAIAKDKAGNEGSAFVEVSVRQTAQVGEIEYFDKVWSTIGFFANSEKAELESGYVEGYQFGKQPHGDGFAYVRSAPKGSVDTYSYPGFSIAPRQTLEKISEAVTNGYNKLVMRCYLDYTSPRTLYQKWSGKQVNLGQIQPKVWTDFVVDKDGSALLEHYSKIANGVNAGGENFIYLGNDPDYTPDNKKGDFKLYIDWISLVKTASDITISADFLNQEYASGEVLDLATFSAQSAAHPDEEFSLFVTNSLSGETEELIGDSYTFKHGGNYIFTAKFKNPNLSGSATKATGVVGSVNDFEVSYAEAVAIEDRESDEFKAKLDELKLNYQTLNDADRANVYEKFSKLLSNMPSSSATYYAAIDNGASVIKSSANNDYVETPTAAASFDSSKAYGNEYGSTKILFSAWNTEWYGSLNITFGTSAVENIGEYTHIEFYIMGTTWIAARPITFTVKDADVDGSKYIINNTATVNNVWQKVSIPLSAVEDISRITMRFYTKNNNDPWGSVWNADGRMQVNISNLYLVKNN